jgi:hypothetical protein
MESTVPATKTAINAVAAAGGTVCACGCSGMNYGYTVNSCDLCNCQQAFPQQCSIGMVVASCSSISRGEDSTAAKTEIHAVTGGTVCACGCNGVDYGYTVKSCDLCNCQQAFPRQCSSGMVVASCSLEN